MYNKSIAVVLFLVFLLGLFFQYNRTDGFVRLIKNKNIVATSHNIYGKNEAKAILPREQFLVIYDQGSVQSLFLRHTIESLAESLKKEVVAIPARSTIAPLKGYAGVFLATDNLDTIVDMHEIRRYAQEGGHVYFMMHPLAGNTFQSLMPELGIAKAGGEVQTDGIRIQSDLLLGGKDFKLDGNAYQTAALQLQLKPTAKVHMISQQGIPLIWETKYGQGKYFVYNGTGLADKINRGLLTSLLATSKSVYVYPVVGVKVMFLDDFPAPAPEGDFDEIYQEFKLTTPQFYRQVWWPDILKLGEKYDVKYTGVIIESYNNQVKGPFKPEKGIEAKNNLIVYGRELLKCGGELGIHGYNHQSLAPAGYGQEKLGYNAWQSQADMEEALTELKRYVEEFYPAYAIRSYVPPSNVLSPEGKAALQKVFPDLKIFSSLYNGVSSEEKAYYQDFRYNPDDSVEFPRVSSGYIMEDAMEWEMLNIISAYGIVSHFVHPDEMFYEESSGITWRQMREGFEALLQELQDNFGWLRACTVSQGVDYLNEYFDLDYRIEATEKDWTMYCWGFSKEVYFVLRTDKKIAEASGCDIQQIDEHAYLLKISKPEVHLIFKGDNAK